MITSNWFMVLSLKQLFTAKTQRTQRKHHIHRRDAEDAE